MCRCSSLVPAPAAARRSSIAPTPPRADALCVSNSPACSHTTLLAARIGADAAVAATRLRGHGAPLALVLCLRRRRRRRLLASCAT